METGNCILGFDECFEDGIICDSSANMDVNMSDDEMVSIIKAAFGIDYKSQNI